MARMRERPEDIHLLFRKFAQDFAERYRMPAIRINEEAQNILLNYRWPGNIRQLKNITEQISVIEKERVVTSAKLKSYLPDYKKDQLPALYKAIDEKTFSSEREILYKILFDMKNDMNDLKKIVRELITKDVDKADIQDNHSQIIQKLYQEVEPIKTQSASPATSYEINPKENYIQDTEEIVEESLSLEAKEIEMIKKALEKHSGKRKLAAEELGISERTLYRKIKEYKI